MLGEQNQLLKTRYGNLKMLKKTLLPALALGAMGAIATSAQAYEMSSYVQIGIGQAKAEKSSASKAVQSAEFGGRTSSSRTDTAYKIAVGLKFNPYLAVEAQYIDLGKESYKGSYSSYSNLNSSFEKMNFKTSGIGANIIGSYPIEDFTVFAKTGYHYLKTKATYREGQSLQFGSSHSYSKSSKSSKNNKKWSPSLGVGVSYAMTAHLVITAEYERFQGVGKDLYLYYPYSGSSYSAKHDIDLASIGLRYHF